MSADPNEQETLELEFIEQSSPLRGGQSSIMMDESTVGRVASSVVGLVGGT